MLSGLLLAMSLQLPPKVVTQPFRSRTRRDTTETYIILHNDSSPSPRVTFRFLRKKHNSYHYYIDRRGTVYNLVNPSYVANHAGFSYYDGKFGMNSRSIGICLENVPPAEYTFVQYQSLAWLVNSLHVRYPDSRRHLIVGHQDVAIPRGRKSDPGPKFLWTLLYSMLPPS